jgi:hypothetical protein
MSIFPSLLEQRAIAYDIWLGLSSVPYQQERHFEVEQQSLIKGCGLHRNMRASK